MFLLINNIIMEEVVDTLVIEKNEEWNISNVTKIMIEEVQEKIKNTTQQWVDHFAIPSSLVFL